MSEIQYAIPDISLYVGYNQLSKQEEEEVVEKDFSFDERKEEREEEMVEKDFSFDERKEEMEERDVIKYIEKEISITTTAPVLICRDLFFRHYSRVFTNKFLQQQSYLNTSMFYLNEELCLNTLIKIYSYEEDVVIIVRCLHSNTSTEFRDSILPDLKKSYFLSRSIPESELDIYTRKIEAWRYPINVNTCSHFSLSNSRKRWSYSNIKGNYFRLNVENLSNIVMLLSNVDGGLKWCPSEKELLESIYMYNVYMVIIDGNLIGLFVMNFYTLATDTGNYLNISQVVYQIAIKDIYMSTVLDCIHDLCKQRTETCIVGYITGQITHELLEKKNIEILNSEYYLNTHGLYTGHIELKDLYIPLF